MNETITRELIAARKAVREKYLDLKRDKLARVAEQKEAFRPITEPLEKLLQEQTTEIKNEPLTPIIKSTPFIKKSNYKITPKSVKRKLKFSKGPTSSYQVIPSSPHYISEFNIKHPGDKVTRPGNYKRLEVAKPSFATVTNEYIEDDGINLSLNEEPWTDKNELFPPSEFDFNATMLEQDPESEEEPATDNTQQVKQLYDKSPGGVAGQYLQWRFSNDDAVDNIYGIKLQGDSKYTIGNKPVEIKNDQIIFQDGSKIDSSKGLWELLVKKNPNEKLITEEDKATYRGLLLKTNAHKQNYDSARQINSNKGAKYNKVIKPLMHEVPSSKTGESYKYYDDPEELVVRLKILVASTQAGHTNHNNEIISIIEELRQGGYIIE